MPHKPQTHKQRQSRPKDNRPSAAQRGYGRRWQKIRAAHLRANPLCVECLANGRSELATIVDHIEPHRGDTVRFWAKENLQSLCIECHNRKTGKGQ